VTADVPIGFVVAQVNVGFVVQVLPLRAIVQDAVLDVNVPDIKTNDAMTVQLAVIAFVVYVVPASDPPQVPATDAEYPEFGVTVNVFVVP
jgi:hypothetical protein